MSRGATRAARGCRRLARPRARTLPAGDDAPARPDHELTSPGCRRTRRSWRAPPAGTSRRCPTRGRRPGAATAGLRQMAKTRKPPASMRTGCSYLVHRDPRPSRRHESATQCAEVDPRSRPRDSRRTPSASANVPAGLSPVGGPSGRPRRTGTPMAGRRQRRCRSASKARSTRRRNSRSTGNWLAGSVSQTTRSVTPVGSIRCTPEHVGLAGEPCRPTSASLGQLRRRPRPAPRRPGRCPRPG